MLSKVLPVGYSRIDIMDTTSYVVNSGSSLLGSYLIPTRNFIVDASFTTIETDTITLAITGIKFITSDGDYLNHALTATWSNTGSSHNLGPFTKYAITTSVDCIGISDILGFSLFDEHDDFASIMVDHPFIIVISVPTAT